MSLRVSRRQVLQGAVAALTAGALPTLSPTVSADPPPVFTHPAAALQMAPPRGLGAVTAVLNGVGIYVGNDWFDWSDTARRFALAKIRAWGFDFVCPKVGGYGRTYQRDTAQLREWADAAQGIGLGFVPFLYTIPETAERDARLAAEIANTVGIVCVDMEDEWGANEKGAAAGYKGAEMAAFGRVYRQEAGAKPIIVTGYGDPITRFGPAATGFPHAEMAEWADAYSPQWYVGVYARYHKGGVQAALDWGVDECRQALGPAFPLCPSVAVDSIYTPDGLFPLPDTRLLMEKMRAYQAPVFVWEYQLMTPAHAEALLGPPQVKHVRLGETRQTSFAVVWDTSVPARSKLTCQAGSAPVQTSQGKSLELTHAEGIDKLAAGTVCAVTVQASSGGGDSPLVPLTVVTAPAVPGVFAQAALAVRDPLGHIAITLLIASSADSDCSDVSVTSVTTDSGTVLAPTALPISLGPLRHRDWAASTLDRAPLSVVIAGLTPNAAALTLHLAGTAVGGSPWTASLPVTLPDTGTV